MPKVVLHLLFLSLICIKLCNAQTQEVKNPEQNANNITAAQESQIEKLNELAFSCRNSNPSKSLSLSDMSLALSRKHNYNLGEINALLLSGMVYKNIGAYDKAAAYYFDALKLAKKVNDQERISSCLNNIGSLYQLQNNFIKALQYYQLSMQIEETLDNKEQLSIRLYNIGTVYESIDSLNLALTYYYNSLLIEEQIGNDEGVYFALYGIAGIETKTGQYESAMRNITRALKVTYKLNDVFGKALCHNELGKLYLAKGDFGKAILEFDSSIYWSESSNLMNEMKESFFDLAQAYESLGKHESAFNYLSRYVELSDSLNSVEMGTRIAETETRYQVDQKETEIAYLKNLNELKSENADSERRNRNFLLITIVLVILLSAYNLKRITENIKGIILITISAFGFLILLSLLMMQFLGIEGWSSFTRTFADVLTYSILPFFIAILAAERVLFKKYIKLAQELNAELKELNIPENEDSIKLQFDGKEASLNLAIKDLLCFEANDNYTAIYYLRDGKVKKELYRITLKKIEDQVKGYGQIIRCHKSYIINVGMVSKVTGNAQGYKLQMTGVEVLIPVSRSFPKSMISNLKSKSEE